MATKIKLDLDATDVITFDRAVDIPTFDGRPLKITFTFTYRDREQVAALFDSYKKRSEDAAKARLEQAGADDESIMEIVRKTLADDVEMLMEIASGWNIDAPWNAESVRKMCLRYAGAATAIVTDYRISLTQGRLGN